MQIVSIIKYCILYSSRFTIHVIHDYCKRSCIILSLLLLMFPFIASSQYSITAIVRNQQTKEPLPGAIITIPKYNITAQADSTGKVYVHNIPKGEVEAYCSYVGFAKKKKEFVFPSKKESEIWEISLEQSAAELEEIIISTTRNNKNIDLIPTRLEAITREEMDEKSAMKPGDIKMLLNESTGITTQQTSAVSGAADIRIQGLDGKYTQLLKDGMPLFNGFSGGLSILQIPPLDLKQVEFIKGSASTLYGGGAIAGLVNLISRTPTPKKELSVLLNGTSAKGLDVSTFYAEKFKKTGTTIYAAYNYNDAYAPSATGFSAIPKTKRWTINPTLFYYPDNNTTCVFGVNFTNENRFGGDMKVIEGHADSIHQYYEENNASRISTHLNIEHKINSHNRIQFKNAVGYYKRQIMQPGTGFYGQQTSSFSEINYTHTQSKMEWVTGLNFCTEHFNPLDTSRLNYNLNTGGLFIQNTYKPNRWFTLETGLRTEINSSPAKNQSYGLFILPSVNTLFKINKQFSSRIGGGMGYKMPSPFNEEAEEKGYQYIMPININSIDAEKSYGLHADITYKIKVEETGFSINQLFFYTKVNSPLILNGNSFTNANGYLDTKGMETNIRMNFDELNFYIGYTLADVKLHYDHTVTTQPLTAQNRINFDVTYEKENSFRVGFEAFYTGTQMLHDGSTAKDFLILGFLFQKTWKKIDFFINTENFTDSRQTKWDALYSGTVTHPVFKDVYTALEGAVANMGVRIKL